MTTPRTVGNGNLYGVALLISDRGVENSISKVDLRKAMFDDHATKSLLTNLMLEMARLQLMVMDLKTYYESSRDDRALAYIWDMEQQMARMINLIVRTNQMIGGPTN